MRPGRTVTSLVPQIPPSAEPGPGQRRTPDLAFPAGLEPPLARREEVTWTRHGVTEADPYAWLRAENWREAMRDPATLPDPIRAYLEAENVFAREMLAGTQTLQADLVREMRGRIKEDDSSPPLPDGPFAYSVRFTAGAEQPAIVRAARDGGDPRVVLDANGLAEGTDYFRLGTTAHSPDHRRLAWSADRTGSEDFTVRVRDLDTLEDLPDTIPETAGTLAWAADGETLFYVRLDANHRPASVWRHRCGTPAEADTLVYEEADPGFFVGLSASRCGRHLVIDSHDHETSEIRLVPADRPSEPPRIVVARTTGVEYGVEPHGDRLFVLTNAGGAEDFEVLSIASDATTFEGAETVVPHQPGRLILSIHAYRNHLVRLERWEGLPRIVVRRLDTGEEHEIAFPEAAYSLGVVEGYEFDTATVRFSYSSPTTPPQVFDYDMDTRERNLVKATEIPSGHDPANYRVERLFARAADGETVPVTVLARADTPRDGTAPGVLYGYGAYGISIPASFSSNVLSLVDRGVVYAIAHVRGGKDKGYRWYRLGRREHKTNTFTDFVAAADHLVAEGIVRRDALAAQGGSAGGMLMGVVANTAADRFAAIVAEVPFVDVLNTMCDDTLPLTPPEWPEWGNPVASEVDFRRIRGYSPYENVAARPYPAILALAGVSDPRVTYWEPAKWVARLRATATGGGPILLKTNMGAGHGGASGRFRRLEEVATIQAFVLTVFSERGALPAAR